MVKNIVRLTVNLALKNGQIDALHNVMEAMTKATSSEPGTLGYEWFAGPDGKTFRLVETYADAKAIEAHFLGPVVQEWVPKLVAICDVTALEFYGDPGQTVMAMAGGMGAVQFEYVRGLDR